MVARTDVGSGKSPTAVVTGGGGAGCDGFLRRTIRIVPPTIKHPIKTITTTQTDQAVPNGVMLNRLVSVSLYEKLTL